MLSRPRRLSAAERARARAVASLTEPDDDTDWTLVRQRLAARSGGRCECCGTPLGFLPWEAHHRTPRGMGGTTDAAHRDCLARLVALHKRCHLWIESYRDLARARGLLVDHSRDFHDAVLMLASGRRVLLDDNGLYLRALPEYALHVPLPSASWLMQ